MVTGRFHYSMFSFFTKKEPVFESQKLKANLKMSVTRIRMQQDKRRNNVRRTRREIAELLAGGKLDPARIKVEGVMREHKSIDGLDALALFIEFVVTRAQYIGEVKTCPPDLKEAISSILWAVPRIDDIPELQSIRLQFALKFGKHFCEMCAENGELSVNSRVIEKLGGELPPSSECLDYLQGIADEYQVESFDRSAFTTPGSTLVCDAPLVGVNVPGAGLGTSGADAAASLSGAGPSIPPITVPRDALEVRLLALSRA